MTTYIYIGEYVLLMKMETKKQMNKEKFWEIVADYPQETKGYEIGRFRYDEELNLFHFHDGSVRVYFKNEVELRKVMESFDYEAELEDPMILYCKNNCGHIWQYQGKAEDRTSCPRCGGHISLENQVNEPLGETGPWSGAEYLGVSVENSILYYDDRHRVVIEFFGEPDPYSRWKESEVAPEDLVEWLKNYNWNVGLSYRCVSLPVEKEGKK